MPTCVAGDPSRVSKKNACISSLQLDGNDLKFGKHIDSLSVSCPWEAVHCRLVCVCTVVG